MQLLTLRLWCLTATSFGLVPRSRSLQSGGLARGQRRSSRGTAARRGAVAPPTMILGLGKLVQLTSFLKPKDVTVLGAVGVFLAYQKIKVWRNGATTKQASGMAQGANYHYVPKTAEEEKMLKTFVCDKCGFEIYLALNRVRWHFRDIGEIKCMVCGAKPPDFYNENDENDPLNLPGAHIRDMNRDYDEIVKERGIVFVDEDGEEWDGKDEEAVDAASSDDEVLDIAVSEDEIFSLDEPVEVVEVVEEEEASPAPSPLEEESKVELEPEQPEVLPAPVVEEEEEIKVVVSKELDPAPEVPEVPEVPTPVVEATAAPSPAEEGDDDDALAVYGEGDIDV